MSILDHVVVHVKDYARSKAFYERALAPLGVTLVREYGQFGGFGKNRKPDFWIAAGGASYFTDEHRKGVITPVHVAFAAASRAEVDAFYRAAIEAGAKDFGPPGPRPMYHANYYGAFVLDPDGHDVEAVTHRPE